MVQFLSNFFLDFFNFCWVFQKFTFFCVTLYIMKKLRGCGLDSSDSEQGSSAASCAGIRTLQTYKMWECVQRGRGGVVGPD